MDYEIRVDENANDKYGAFKVGTHDDLVTSLGLAVQWSPEWLTPSEDILRAFAAELAGQRMMSALNFIMDDQRRGQGLI